MSAINQITCQHVRLSPPRARRCAGRLVQHRQQCLDCGRAVGSAVAKAVAWQETGGQPEPFDEAFFDAGRQATEAYYQGLDDAREAERDEWWAWYNRYLESPEWQARRAKVLRRANGICEGCLAGRAVHVHHKTYVHVGNELLYELAALCEACHDRAHTDNPNVPPPAYPLVARGGS